MKLTIDRLRLLKVLNTVSIAIGQKSPTPAFLNFKMEMSNDCLTVTGSNNDLTIKSSLPLKDGDNDIIVSSLPGSTLIALKLLEIIRRLEGSWVTIEVIDNTAKISDEKSDFQLNSMPVEDYPELDLEAFGETITFKVEDFKKIVSQTAFAASTKEVRPILTSINVKAYDNQLEFTATDSYRLSKKLHYLENEGDAKSFEVNIPVKTMVEVSKLLESGTVDMIVSSNKVVFKYNNTFIYSRLNNGDFPKASRMIPDAYPFVLQVNADTFINAMSRVSLLAIERENIVKVTVDYDELIISSKSDQIGSAKEKISSSSFRYAGDRFEISFNCNYVDEAIKAAQSDEVILSFAGEMTAFRVTAPNDASIIQVIVPARSYY